MSKHTPTPWKIQQNKNNKFEIFVIEEHGLAYWICEHVEKHDAEFIVRAVNSHDNLLKAAKEALEFIRGKTTKEPIFQKLEQAIAAAEGKE